MTYSIWLKRCHANTQPFQCQVALTGLGTTQKHGNPCQGETSKSCDSPVLTENFAYDEQSRLVSETGSAENDSYQYDADGNRIAQTVNGTSMNLIYEGGSNRIIQASQTTFGYDAVGNSIVANGISRWQFDPFNRMTTAFGNTYHTDPLGQLLVVIVGYTPPLAVFFVCC